MPGKQIKYPPSEWVAARLAEMDAVLNVVEKQPEYSGTRLQNQTEEALEAMKASRAQLQAVAQKVLRQQSAAIPKYKEEMAPIWNEFEKSLKLWTDLTKAQDRIYSAQLRAQAEMWDTFFAQCKSAAKENRDAVRASMLDQIDEVEKQVASLQIQAASTEYTRWPTMTDALDQLRNTTENAAQELLAAINNSRP